MFTPKKHYRTIFISDTHLGSRTANAPVLLDFLRHHSCNKLVIVGDLLDFWALRRSLYFPDSHKEVLRIIIKWSARGVIIEYIPGNHDEAIRAFLPIIFDNIKVVHDSTHTTVDGKRFFVTHGDDYDQIMRYAKWIAWLGDIGYHGLIHTNYLVNWLRRHCGYGYWSLSAWVKHSVKTAVNVISNYEAAVVKHVLEKGYDGVICGHIHCPELREMNGIVYANCGDFVESCTALTEDENGVLEIVAWRIGMTFESETVDYLLTAEMEIS